MSTDTFNPQAIAGLPFGKEKVKLPVAGEFTAGGFIGPAVSMIAWMFTTEANHIDFNQGLPVDQKVVPDLVIPWGDWGFAYYWLSKFEPVAGQEEKQDVGFLKASDAFKAMAPVKAKKFSVQRVWRLEIAKDEILNWSSPEAAAKWTSDPIGFDVQLRSLRSKYRHEFQFMSLPAAIAAVARYGGSPGATYDLDELKDQATVYSDDFQSQYTGHPDAKKADRIAFEGYIKEQMESPGVTEDEAIQKGYGEFIKVPWQYSILYRRRAALWASLGEENALAYNGKGVGTKYDTDSDTLDRCLGIVSEWTAPLYVRLESLADPRVDATRETDDGETRRLTVPCITEIYTSSTDAQAAADADKGDDESAPAVSSKGTGYPSPPPGWDGSEAVFADEVKATAGKAAVLVAKELRCDVSYVEAYRRHLGL